MQLALLIFQCLFSSIKNCAEKKVDKKPKTTVDTANMFLCMFDSLLFDDACVSTIDASAREIDEHIKRDLFAFPLSPLKRCSLRVDFRLQRAIFLRYEG